MKKLFITLLASSFCFILTAQDPTLGQDIPTVNDDFLHPGRMYIGGSLAFTGYGEKHKDANSTENGPKQSNLTILPEFGYVLNDKFAVDVALGYASSTFTQYQPKNQEEGDWELKDKSGMFVFMPMLKAYKKVSNRLYCMPSLELSVGFGNSSDDFVGFNEENFEEEIQSNEYKEFAFGGALRAGLKFFPSNTWAFSFSYGALYYNTVTSTDKANTDHKWTTNSYGLDLNLSSVRVGAYYFLK